MAIPKTIKRHYLDEEALFRHMYVDMGTAGSLGKLQKWWTQRDGLNPNTKKMFSREAMYQACWRWALRNLVEAKQIYTEYLVQYGIQLTDDMWTTTVRQRAITCKKTAARGFFRDNPEYAPDEE